MARNHHGAKFSIPVPVLYQSSWKFCIYLHLGFVTLLHAVVLAPCSCMGRNLAPSKFCVHSQMLCSAEFSKVNITGDIPSKQPNHFHSRNCIQNACWHILHL
jgi:hypothetical protein